MSDMLNEGFPFAENALAGRTALVCGASAGIGRATAQMLARAGARVIACARSADALEELVAELHGSGHEMLVLDLEDAEAVREAEPTRWHAEKPTARACWMICAVPANTSQTRISGADLRMSFATFWYTFHSTL